MAVCPRRRSNRGLSLCCGRPDGSSPAALEPWHLTRPGSWSFLVLFFMQFAFLAQGSRYFRARAMSTLCKELEGRSWNWTRQLPLLLKLVNQHSAAFLAILIFGYVLSFIAYFVYSDLDPVGGLLVFYVSRVMFGFYMNGVLFCMPVLFALEAHMVSHRVQAFTEAIGKFPNLDSAIEEHIEIWKCAALLF